MDGALCLGKNGTDKIGMKEERKISMEDVSQLVMLRLILKYTFLAGSGEWDVYCKD